MPYPKTETCFDNKLSPTVIYLFLSYSLILLLEKFKDIEMIPRKRTFLCHIPKLKHILIIN